MSEETSLQAMNRLRRENSQLHRHAERLSRIVRRWVEDPALKYFWTAEEKGALDDYLKFKDEVIWEATPPN